ncbi:hypothetical protein OQA88_1444 [Cercophora sp. LCS_1]
MPPPDSPTDVILPTQDPYMEQVIAGTKNYEFRKYRPKPTAKRIYETLPARTRNKGDPPLAEDGLGNAELNSRHKDWAGRDFAYKILSVYELWEPIPLAVMKSDYGFKGPPRGMVYLPDRMAERVVWRKQRAVLARREGEGKTQLDEEKEDEDDE